MNSFDKYFTLRFGLGSFCQIIRLFLKHRKWGNCILQICIRLKTVSVSCHHHGPLLVSSFWWGWSDQQRCFEGRSDQTWTQSERPWVTRSQGEVFRGNLAGRQQMKKSMGDNKHISSQSQSENASLFGIWLDCFAWVRKLVLSELFSVYFFIYVFNFLIEFKINTDKSNQWMGKTDSWTHPRKQTKTLFNFPAISSELKFKNRIF